MPRPTTHSGAYLFIFATREVPLIVRSNEVFESDGQRRKHQRRFLAKDCQRERPDGGYLEFPGTLVQLGKKPKCQQYKKRYFQFRNGRNPVHYFGVYRMNRKERGGNPGHPPIAK